MKTGFIPDGYVLDGFAAETPFYPAVRFKYRPCVGTENYAFNWQQAALFDKKSSKDAERARKNIADLLAKHLVCWDLKSPDGNDVEVSAENALRLEPNLSAKLYAIVMAYEASDEADGEKPDEKPKGDDAGN